MAGADAISISALVKRYGDIVAIDDLDLRVESGSVSALLGPNGAGKTTLMCVIFGLIRPDAGEVSLFGRSLATEGVAAREGVAGFIETPTFYPYLSGRRNLELLVRLDLDADGRGRIDEVLATTGLTDRARDKVKTYSFGMRQRLGIAAALLREPRLLVIDEPSTGLDPAGIREMRQLIARLAESGITLLISSHNMLEVEQLCDHVTIMRTGAVVFDGSMDELRDKAPEPAYLLRTSDDGSALAVLTEFNGVSEPSRRDVGIRFHASEPAVEKASRRIVERGIDIRSLAALEPPLETLFFDLTGGEGSEVETRHLKAAS